MAKGLISAGKLLPALIAGLLAFDSLAHAEPPPASSEPPPRGLVLPQLVPPNLKLPEITPPNLKLPEISPPNLKLPEIPPPTEITLGGQLFWADELLYRDWRIQRHVFSGQYRLLDGGNRRRARGTFHECRSALDRLRQELKLPPMQGKGVLVLHGLAGMRMLAGDMAGYLRDNGEYQVFCLSYPSQFDDIGSHAQSLASVMEHLDGLEEINFVAHSMGNLVIRHYLADAEKAGKPDPRIRRIVMIGAPNNGSKLALRLGDNPLVVAGLGESGQQLGKRWLELAPRLATPTCEFGVIAGGNGTPKGMLPVLEEDNDGLVSVASTRLPGARDFIVVPVMHYGQLHSAEVQRYTLHFLKSGCFIAEDQRRPIERSE